METEIAKLIKRGRERKKLSRIELAHLLDVSPGAITHWESNHREPSGAILLKIIKVLDLVSDFFPDSIEGKSVPLPKSFNLEERVATLEEAILKKR